MSATHRCPHCNKKFEYHPQDYHRQVRCGNARCDAPFGFYLYTIPTRVEAELFREIKAEQVHHSHALAYAHTPRHTPTRSHRLPYTPTHSCTRALALCASLS